MPYPKPCKRCGVKFQPTGNANKLCEECWKEAQRLGHIKMKLNRMIK